MEETSGGAVLRTIATVFGNLALALAVSATLPAMMIAAGLPADLALHSDLVLFFAIFLANPCAAIGRPNALRETSVKLGSALILGVTIAIIISLALPDGWLTGAGLEQSRGASSTALLGLIFTPFLIVPIAFLGPVLERILRGAGPDGATLRRDDLQIGLVFPIFMSVTLTLNIAVVVALFAIQAPLTLGLAILTLGVLAAIAETCFAKPDDLPATPARPRLETAQEAWKGLRKALRGSCASALFVGALLYTSLAMGLPLLQGTVGMEADILGLLTSLAQGAGVIMASSAGLVFFGCVLAASAAYAVGERHGLDPLAMEALGKYAVGRLFIGEIHWVRPDPHLR